MTRPQVDMDIVDSRWRDADIDTVAARAIGAALDLLGMGAQPTEVSILACNDARMADLNTAFRSKPAPTNVLSWPEEDLASDDGAPPRLPTADPDGTVSLGDIAIAYDTCAREADLQGKPFDHHVTHLLVHGLLHLLGYDHIRGADAARMEALEVKILGNLGIPDPY
ncbi:MAG: rRNA maturation RNase YbeY [Pseudomonadota bacterium]